MKIYWHNGRKNIIGENLKRIRTQKSLTQNELASLLQLKGYEFDRLAVLRIEKGTRFVPDYEVALLCEALEVSYEELMKGDV